MFQYPYGDSQQLNLDWLMEQWLETKASIDGSLQGEIDRVEAAITDLLTARDQAVAAKTAAESAATSASGYAGTASTAASTATAQAAAAAASAALAGNHASNAQTSETNAGLQATAAGNSASAAATSATNARNSELAAAASSSAAAGNALYSEGWAVGTQNGVPVAPDSPYYENNAKYYAEQGGGGGGELVELKTIENVGIATFDDGVENSSVRELKIRINPVQSGSGAVSPDNIRPFTGWNKAGINVSNENLFSPTTTDTGTTRKYYLNTGFLLKKGITYTLKHNGPATIAVYFRAIDDSDVTPNSVTSGNGTPVAKCTPAEDVYASFKTYTANVADYNDVILELTTDENAEIKTHSGTVIDADFPIAAGTVYSGDITIDSAGNAKLIVDTKYLTIDENSTINDASLGTSQARFIVSASDALNGNIGDLIICDILPIETTTNIYNGSPGIAMHSSKAIWFMWDAVRSTSVANLKANYLSVNPIHVVYKIATPIEYNISGEQLATLLGGYNSIWAESGAITKIKYLAAINVREELNIIKAIIATVEESDTASKAYNVNDFLILDNVLYIVTASIANGGTITVGTNVTATTVGDQITAILNS